MSSTSTNSSSQLSKVLTSQDDTSSDEEAPRSSIRDSQDTAGGSQTSINVAARGPVRKASSSSALSRGTYKGDRHPAESQNHGKSHRLSSWLARRVHVGENHDHERPRPQQGQDDADSTKSRSSISESRLSDDTDVRRPQLHASGKHTMRHGGTSNNQESRGSTDWRKVQDHCVKWSRKVHCGIRVPIEKVRPANSTLSVPGSGHGHRVVSAAASSTSSASSISGAEPSATSSSRALRTRHSTRDFSSRLTAEEQNDKGVAWGRLSDSELKITIRQDIATDMHASDNPEELGTVTLNLAEHAPCPRRHLKPTRNNHYHHSDHHDEQQQHNPAHRSHSDRNPLNNTGASSTEENGVRHSQLSRVETRRFLLEHSKTNATLELTVKMTHIGGSREYTVPSIRHGLLVSTFAEALPGYHVDTQPTNDSETDPGGETESSSDKRHLEEERSRAALSADRPTNNMQSAFVTRENRHTSRNTAGDSRASRIPSKNFKEGVDDSMFSLIKTADMPVSLMNAGAVSNKGGRSVRLTGLHFHFSGAKELEKDPHDVIDAMFRNTTGGPSKSSRTSASRRHSLPPSNDGETSGDDTGSGGQRRTTQPGTSQNGHVRSAVGPAGSPNQKAGTSDRGKPSTKDSSAALADRMGRQNSSETISASASCSDVSSAGVGSDASSVLRSERGPMRKSASVAVGQKLRWISAVRDRKSQPAALNRGDANDSAQNKLPEPVHSSSVRPRDHQKAPVSPAAGCESAEAQRNQQNGDDSQTKPGDIPNDHQPAGHKPPGVQEPQVSTGASQDKSPIRPEKSSHTGPKLRTDCNSQQKALLPYVWARLGKPRSQIRLNDKHLESIAGSGNAAPVSRDRSSSGGPTPTVVQGFQPLPTNVLSPSSSPARLTVTPYSTGSKGNQSSSKLSSQNPDVPALIPGAHPVKYSSDKGSDVSGRESPASFADVHPSDSLNTGLTWGDADTEWRVQQPAAQASSTSLRSGTEGDARSGENKGSPNVSSGRRPSGPKMESVGTAALSNLKEHRPGGVPLPANYLLRESESSGAS